MFEGINVWAVLVAAVSAFVLGGLWYSPLLFLKPWMRGTGITEAEMQAAHPGKVYGTSFILSLISAIVFAIFLGPQPDLGFAVGAGFSAGAFWVAASFGINYLFEQKPLVLFGVNGGYHTVQFTLYGLILGWWH